MLPSSTTAWIARASLPFIEQAMVTELNDWFAYFKPDLVVLTANPRSHRRQVFSDATSAWKRCSSRWILEILKAGMDDLQKTIEVTTRKRCRNSSCSYANITNSATSPTSTGSYSAIPTSTRWVSGWSCSKMIQIERSTEMRIRCSDPVERIRMGVNDYRGRKRLSDDETRDRTPPEGT